MRSIKLLHCTKPCAQCPFRKDSMKGWLGKKRMIEILKAKSFTCHKTNKKLQCAGHMIIKKHENDFVFLALRLGLKLNLSGHDLIFESEKELILHHTF